LLEVLVGIALLGSAGLGVVLALRQATVAEAAAAQAERHSAVADRLLSAMTLLRPGELDQRIGTHRIGEFVIHVARPEPTLYRIALADTAAADHELLTTVVFRARPTEAE
jgi:hypothetical protein